MVRQRYFIFILLVSFLLFSTNFRAAQSQDNADTATATPDAAKATIKVGSKEFTEQLLLGKMLVLMLQDAGYQVEDKTGIGGSPAAWAALQSGEIDMYPEYTGTSLTLHNSLPAAALPSDPAAVYALAKSLDAAKGLVWLAPAVFNDTYTLLVRQEMVDEGITTIQALADFMNANAAPFTICIESEFYGREQDGLAGLQQRYGFSFKQENVLFMDLNETYDALREGTCDVSEGFSTDGRINAWGFYNLEDTLNFFPVYNPAPVIRQAVLQSNPELEVLLNQLGQHLDNDAMSQLNARVDIGPDGVIGSGDEESVETVASNFLQSVKLLQLPTIKVGSKEFTEQLLLGKMLVLMLQDAGYQVEDKTGIGGSPAAWAALQSGEIDMYPEYTGTSLTLHNSLPAAALPSDPDRVYLLAKSLDAAKGLVWLAPAVFNDTYTLLVRQEMVDEGITTIQALADFMNANAAPFTICIESEFYGREQDGLAGLQQRYGFSFKQENVLFMDLNETYDALREGTCDVSEGFSTDGRINAWGFYNLEDTLNFFPVYNPAPVIRQAVLQSNPELEVLLNQLGQHLDNDAMSQLNARVDIGPDGVIGSGDEESVETVAFSFLRSKRLLQPPSITVGSKDYTEQLILGKIMVLLLQDAGYAVIDKTGTGGSRVVRQAIENNEIDLYVELTGSSLAVHNALPADALPSDPDKAHSLAKSLDERKGIIWLDRGAFNDTYAIMVRDDLWEEGIQTLTDLADFMNENDAPLTICVENDFFARDHDGLPALEARYGFTFKPENVLLMDLDETYEGLRNETCDVAEGFSTDGRGAAWGFHNLADTLNFFPFYNPSPVIRKDVLDANPELADILNGFASLLDDTTISELNARVDIGADGVASSADEETPEAVARDFLVTNELIAADDATASAPITETEQISATTTPTSSADGKPALPIAVGSTDGVEQVLLAKLLVLVLEDAGYTVDDQTAAGDADALRGLVEQGNLDLYLDSTSDALTIYHDIAANQVPTNTQLAYDQAQALDATAGLVWLEPTNLNRTYTLIASQATFDQGIRTLEDLAAYMNDNDAPLTLCAESEFLKGKDGILASLENTYGFRFKLGNILAVDPEKVYTSLREDRCDVAEGWTTDGRISAWDFYPLADTLNVFAVGTVAPVVRQAVLAQNPELADALTDLGQALNASIISQLNARLTLGVDDELASGDEETLAEVTTSFLCEQSLIEDCPTSTPTATPTATVVATALVTETEAVSTTEIVTTPTTPPTQATATPTATPGAQQEEVTPTEAASSGAADRVIVSTPGTYAVNARTTASTDAPIVQLLPRSTLLRAVGRTADNTWVQVVLPDGVRAWVFTDAVLTDQDALQTLPVVTPEPLAQ